MVQQVTRGVKVSVDTVYEGALYKNHNTKYAFAYTITIENKSKAPVQLKTRHWEIIDALNTVEIVKGKGVIGQTPILKPGELYRYTSGCVLISPLGAMRGYYSMLNLETDEVFKVVIPTFKLSAPFSVN